MNSETLPVEAMMHIKTLEGRFNTHSQEVEKGLSKLLDNLDRIQKSQEEIRLKAAEERLHTYEKIQEVKDKVAAVEKAATEKNHKLSLQVVAIASAIGMFGGGAGSEIMYRIRQMIPQERSMMRFETSTPSPSLPSQVEVKE